MCLLKERKEKSKEFLLRRLYEQYRIFDATHPNVPSISSLNALVVGRDHADGSSLTTLGRARSY